MQADVQQRMINQLATCDMCADAPDVAPLPALVNGFVTFASFNNMAKITREVSLAKLTQGCRNCAYILTMATHVRTVAGIAVRMTRVRVPSQSQCATQLQEAFELHLHRT